VLGSSVKEKHLKARIQQCLAIAECSNCPRRKFGALLLDPERNIVIVDAYNGAARGGGRLCGGEVCLRDMHHVPSGTSVEIGCCHAEMNVICNAAASGARTAGAWLIVNGEPCLMCAKLAHNSGITKVICVKNGYIAGGDGIAYLAQHGIECVQVDGPQDPRLPNSGG
jgi:dCMP deaminase